MASGRRRRILTFAGVLVTVAALLIAGRAAGDPNGLPPTVADLTRALGATDHVIIYRDGASPEIERVVVHERGRGPEPRTDEATAGTVPAALDGRQAPQVTSGGVFSGPGAAIDTSPRPRDTAISPSGAARTTQEEAAGIAKVIQEGAVPVSVVRDILDRVDVLIQAARDTTLSGDLRPRQ